MLDALAYPHVFDIIFVSASYETLLALRPTSRSLRDRVDAALSRHLVLTNPFRPEEIKDPLREEEDDHESDGQPPGGVTNEDGDDLAGVNETESSVQPGYKQSFVAVSVAHGLRHPAFLDWPVEGAQGVYNWRPSATWDDPSLQLCLKHTRIIDVVGLVSNLALSAICRNLPPGLVMRFRADDEGRWPLAETHRVSWGVPKDGLAPGQPPSRIVWLGDLRKDAHTVISPSLPFGKPAHATCSFIYNRRLSSGSSLRIVWPLPQNLLVIFHPQPGIADNNVFEPNQVPCDGYTLNPLLVPIIHAWSQGSRPTCKFVGLERIPLPWFGGVWAQNAAASASDTAARSNDSIEKKLHDVSLAVEWWIHHWMPRFAGGASSAENEALSRGLLDNISIVTLEDYRASCTDDEYALVTSSDFVAA